jgi:integrase
VATQPVVLQLLRGEAPVRRPNTTSDLNLARDLETLRAVPVTRRATQQTLSGLPPIRLHDLRHGAATLSLAARNDMKTTSAMLRHASVSITADLYTAVLPDVARAAAEASAALVPRRVTVGDPFVADDLLGSGSTRE